MNATIADRARGLAAVTAALLAFAACVPICGIGAKFALSNAHVDAQYDCPSPSDHRPYDVHASVEANNTLSNAVTIKSLVEEDVLVDTAGNWNGPKTAKFTGPVTNYQPKSIGSGSDATIRFTIPFECTTQADTAHTYGDFRFTFTFSTSAGTYTIDAGNRHRLNFPAT